MNTENQRDDTAAGTGLRPVLKVFGVGDAGGCAVEHMAKGNFPGVEFAAINTDVQALAQCAAVGTVQIGAKLTRGLGAGGDPEIGRAAAEEAAEPLRSRCAATDIVFIVVGLGGGSGTGAAPVIARIAREAGALVLAVATLPFDCEGSRRAAQARRGLEELKAAADAVICLPNERVLRLVDEKTSAVETFRITHELLAQGVRGVWQLLARTGIINVNFADLCAVVRGRHAESSFAVAEASGEHRAREVVENLLASPLLDDGRVLADAETVLVSLAGGAGLTMAEINRVMAQINRACENAQVVMGAAVDERLGDQLSVTLIATRRGQSERGDEREAGNGEHDESGSPVEAPSRVDGVAFEDSLLDENASGRTGRRFVPPAPELTPERKRQMLAKQNGGGRRGKSRMRQGMLPLEIVSKGRFEKSEPTIYQGEDLDVPTYIRRGVALN